MARPTFGKYLRIEAKKSLRQLARELGISAVYLGEVERGVKPALKRERWPDVLRALPAVSHEELDRHERLEKPLQLELTDAPIKYQEISFALARRVERRDLSEHQLGEIMRLLKGGRDD